jgi:WD40 repeat protein
LKNDGVDDRCIAVLENHFSVVRGLDFSVDGETLVSGSRDQVVNFWDMKSFKLKTTLPVYEVSHILIGFNVSRLKLWDISLVRKVSIYTLVGVVVSFDYGIPNLVERSHRALRSTMTTKKREEY